MSKIQILLPALEKTKKQKELTKHAFKSLVSFNHCIDIHTDRKPYETAVAGVWNAFLDIWRNGDYDYLMITANDVEHDPSAIDFMVKCLEDNPSAGVVSIKVTRDVEEFKRGFGQQEYTKKLTRGLKDPATFMFRKGVIEKVGRIDEEFPIEFVERDYLYRCRLAGFDWIQPDIILSYHPPKSGTVGNDVDRLNTAYRRYVSKWGGDADQERFRFPYNDFNLNYTHCRK